MHVFLFIYIISDCILGVQREVVISSGEDDMYGACHIICYGWGSKILKFDQCSLPTYMTLELAWISLQEMGDGCFQADIIWESVQAQSWPHAHVSEQYQLTV
jgi:hypothetical protein